MDIRIWSSGVTLSYSRDHDFIKLDFKLRQEALNVHLKSSGLVVLENIPGISNDFSLHKYMCMQKLFPQSWPHSNHVGHDFDTINFRVC
jgi:hypothetical protein